MLLACTRLPTLTKHRASVSGADSIEHEGARAPPPNLQMAGHGGTVSRSTANKKLTKLYWPSRKRSQKRLIVLLEPKKGRARPKTISTGLVSPHFRSAPFLPTLTFKFVPAPLVAIISGRVNVAVYLRFFLSLWIAFNGIYAHAMRNRPNSILPRSHSHSPGVVNICLYLSNLGFWSATRQCSVWPKHARCGTKCRLYENLYLFHRTVVAMYTVIIQPGNLTKLIIQEN